MRKWPIHRVNLLINAIQLAGKKDFCMPLCSVFRLYKIHIVMVHSQRWVTSKTGVPIGFSTAVDEVVLPAL